MQRAPQESPSKAAFADYKNGIQVHKLKLTDAALLQLGIGILGFSIPFTIEIAGLYLSQSSDLFHSPMTPSAGELLLDLSFAGALQIPVFEYFRRAGKEDRLRR